MLQQLIETAFDNRDTLTTNENLPQIREAVDLVIKQLDNGELRVAQKINGIWQVNQWVKKAILLFFKLNNSSKIDSAYTQFFDKVPLKYHSLTDEQWQKNNVRVVPPAHVRYGAYIGANAVLMPSYINIGAYVDSGTMVDTWATVGSCAQIGKNVHLSGGVGIGGVLEPLQANPTIIEDNCFIGARSEIVEGVIVGEGAVVGMGVFIGQSTRIYDREKDTVSYGYVPPGSVVVSGSLPGHNGKYNLYCAVIVKQVDAKTRAKTSINELLRGE
jgi:2,3,4,5-tetrahydropyridine-2-carboxylate N-succinyltransferase